MIVPKITGLCLIFLSSFGITSCTEYVRMDVQFRSARSGSPISNVVTRVDRYQPMSFYSPAKGVTDQEGRVTLDVPKSSDLVVFIEASDIFHTPAASFSAELIKGSLDLDGYSIWHVDDSGSVEARSRRHIND